MKKTTSSLFENPPTLLAAVLLLPVLILVLGVLLYPILNTFWLSFTDLKLSAPKSGVL